MGKGLHDQRTFGQSRIGIETFHLAKEPRGFFGIVLGQFPFRPFKDLFGGEPFQCGFGRRASGQERLKGQGRDPGNRLPRCLCHHGYARPNADPVPTWPAG